MSEVICNELKKQLETKIDSNTFNFWISPLKFNYKSKTLTILSSTEFTLNMVKGRFSDLIKDILNNMGESECKLDYQINENNNKKKAKEKKVKKELKKDESYLEIQTDNDLKLSAKFTFESFVIGNNNQLAFAAANAVVNSLGTSYNPLFIYGSTGLGKTHLMQAIGHGAISLDKKKKISYVTCEEFMNKMIEAIKNRKMDQFRKKFRKVDVLLIDDIQFLANKDTTQEEFFNTFNTLYNDHKQIVITSDCPPQELKNLPKRLVSRFEWGLVTDIQAPSFETRISILQKKIELSKWNVSEEIVSYLATHFIENVRQMEGALTRVYSYSRFLNKPLNIQLIEETLSDLIKVDKVKRVTIDEIVQKVSKFYGVSMGQLRGTKRLKSLTFPRHVAMYMSRELTDHSLPEIGDEFGGKDHTTILHACRKIRKNIETDSKLREDIRNIQKMLNDI